MPSSPVISAVIVSYNTRAMTLRCLETILGELSGLDSEIFLVDNASTDDTLPAVRQQFPSVQIIENKANRGFGAANNQAMQQSHGQFILLLNSDAFPKPGAVRALLDCLQSHPKAAVAGPKLLNPDGSLQLSCFRFPSPTRAWLENLWISSLFPNNSHLGDFRNWPHNELRSVDWVVGACMLVRREAYEQVGGFDEQFFMYAEESDWQKRFRDAGWDIVFTPEAQVTHIGGASGNAQPARINQHFFDSLDSYELKHHGLAGLVALRLAMIIGCFMRAFLWLGAFAMLPAKRELARSKARLCAWLVWRQLSFWHVAHGRVPQETNT